MRVHKYVCTFSYMCACICVCVCICAPISLCTQKCVWVCVCVSESSSVVWIAPTNQTSANQHFLFLFNPQFCSYYLNLRLIPDEQGHTHTRARTHIYIHTYAYTISISIYFTVDSSIEFYWYLRLFPISIVRVVTQILRKQNMMTIVITTIVIVIITISSKRYIYANLHLVEWFWCYIYSETTE